MSGAAGGGRIPRAAVQKTVDDFAEKILSKIPGFKSAKISGSYNRPVKQDFGDIDLIVSIESGEDKKAIKKAITDYFNSLPDNVMPELKNEKYKGKKAINHGEIVTNLYPISGMPGEFVQIDNIIAVSEAEGEFKKMVLDYPAEIQGLILGLVKTVTLEEDPQTVFARLGIKDVPALGKDREYEFHLDTAGLSLRIVTLGEDYKTLDTNTVWQSSSWDDVNKLLKDFDLENPQFQNFIARIKQFKNPRSKNRIKGFFKAAIKVGAAEAGTPKGDEKQKALDTVAALEEKYGTFAASLVKPLLEAERSLIAVFPGKFKPPHKDHLARAQAAAKAADKVIVYIGPKAQGPFTAQQSKRIFELYKEKGLLPSNVEAVISDIPSPVLKAYKTFEENPDQQFIAVFGKEDAERFKGVSKLSNVLVNNFPEANIGNLSATDLRNAILSKDLETIQGFLPKGVTAEEYLKALEMPLNEAKGAKKLRVFDFDDTLAHIKALIRITHKDGSEEELTPAEYAVYTPQKGDTFNFSDFNKVIRQAHPIEDNVEDLIRSYNDPTEKTTILTARMLGYPVKKYLKDEFGIEPYVVGLGSSDPMDKARWIEQQIHKGYTDIEFRDDSQKNVDAVASLKDKYPDVKLTSMLAESYKGKRTKDGAPGTLKAKISKLYGGDVTIEKARKLKNRKNATAHDKRQANWFINFHSKNEAITPDELKAADAFADKQLAPIDVDLTSKHFFDRLQGRGEDISYAQLIGFFKRLGKHKQGFFDFFNKYKEIVATDDRTDLNIPFLNMANKAIAKTILRKDDFQTSNPQLTFEEEGKAAPYGSGYKPVEETLMPYIAELTGYMVENGLSIDDAPEVHFIEDEENAQDIFGRTAYYNPQDKSITLYVTGRHPKDILRSFAHEMIHYCQDCEGRLHNVSTVDINEDDRLKELEREAYERGNLYFRGWENSRSKEPLREGSYDSMTREVVKDVLDYWKKNFHGQDDEDIIYESEYDFTTPKGHQIEFELNAGLLLRQTEEHRYYPDGGINQDFDPPYMELNFQVDPRDLPQAWSKIYEDLTDVVRHEIEHLTQMGLNVIASKELPDDQVIRKMIDADLLPKAQYFKLESEIDAMLQGMYLKAKKTRTPFADVIHTYLDKQPISKEDKEVILNLWRSRRKALSLPEF